MSGSALLSTFLVFLVVISGIGGLRRGAGLRTRVLAWTEAGRMVSGGARASQAEPVANGQHRGGAWAVLATIRLSCHLLAVGAVALQTPAATPGHWNFG